MTTIPAALAALEQVRLVERKDGTTYSVYDGGDMCYKAIDDAKLDAIAWIKEALPWLEKVRDSLAPLKNGDYLDDSEGIQYELGEIKELERLIEQAEGGKA